MDDSPGDRWQVLLVDDDEDDYLITRDALKNAPGIHTELTWAKSYNAGLQMLTGCSFDVILVDYDLGGRTGVQFIRETLQRGCPAPLILFTGRGSFETEIEAMEAGASFYLVKSEATPRLLKRALGYAIERRHMGDELDRRLQERLDILESIQDGFFSINRDWQITYINQRAAQFGGYNRQALIGKNIWDAFPRLRSSFFEQAYRQAMEERKTVQFDAPGLYSGVWYGITVYPSVEGISVFWQDISERKLRELNTEFLAQVNEDFTHIPSPAEIMQAVGKKIYERFNLSRLNISYVDEAADTITVVYDRCEPGMASALGVHALSNYFDANYITATKQEPVLSINNIAADARTSAHAAAFQAFNVYSQLQASYISEGTWQFLITLNKNEPYSWTLDQTDLLGRLAPRLYLTLERARAAEALRESEAKYRQLAELSPDAILVNLNGQFVYANPAAVNLLGAKPDGAEAILDHSPFEFIDAEYHDLVRGRIRHVIEEQTPTSLISYPWRRLDGSTIDVEVVGGPITWKGLPAVVVILRNITERKRMERALIESEYRFRTMADGVPMIIWVTDAEGKMMFVNRAYTQFFGLSIDQVQFGGWQALIHPDDDYYIQIYLECLRLRQPFHAEARVRRYDGQWRRIVSSGQPRFSADGEFLGMAGTSYEQ